MIGGFTFVAGALETVAVALAGVAFAAGATFTGFGAALAFATTFVVFFATGFFATVFFATGFTGRLATFLATFLAAFVPDAEARPVDAAFRAGLAAFVARVLVGATRFAVVFLRGAPGIVDPLRVAGTGRIRPQGSVRS
jgi:hypothetical protein